MKKRRELDALVSNGKLRRKSRSGQELLRSASGGDSDSSETEFTVPAQKAIIRKRSRSTSCTTCLTITGFLVLVACLVACGTLLWMHFALRKNLDYFQKKLETAENKNQLIPEQFQKLHSHVQILNKTLNSYKTGQYGLDNVVVNLTKLSKQIFNMKTIVVDIDKTLKTATSYTALPAKIEVTSKSLASIGSGVSTIKKTIETLQQFRRKTESILDVLLKKVNQSSGGSKTSEFIMRRNQSEDQLDKKLLSLSEDIESLNNSISDKLGVYIPMISKHHIQLDQLENQTEALQMQLVGSSANGNGSIKKQLVQYINQMLLQNNSEEYGTGKILDSLIKSVENITNIVQQMRTEFQRMKDQVLITTNPSVIQPSSSPYVTWEKFSLFNTVHNSEMRLFNSTQQEIKLKMNLLSEQLNSSKAELESLAINISTLQAIVSVHNDVSSSSEQPKVLESDVASNTGDGRIEQPVTKEHP